MLVNHNISMKAFEAVSHRTGITELHCAVAEECQRLTLGRRVTCPVNHYYFSCQPCCSPPVFLSKPMISEKHSVSRLEQLNQFPLTRANHHHSDVIAAHTARPDSASTSSTARPLSLLTVAPAILMHKNPPKKQQVLFRGCTGL